jgi:hypothetical protein
MNIKQITILASCGVFFLALASCKSLQEVAQSKKFTQPEGVTLMTEQDLRDTLVGNTYKGDSVRYPGSTYIEYIHPDGKISGLWNGQERYKGEWVISDKLWCYKYKNSNGCNTLSKSGATIFWYGLDGTSKGGKSLVVSGDPNQLTQ